MNSEKYPRGRRGSPAKGVVRENRSEGSNPSFSANKKDIHRMSFLLVIQKRIELFPQEILRRSRRFENQIDLRSSSTMDFQQPLRAV